MALSWKLVIDSTNAPAVADFWAAALDYEVEDPSALIERLLAAGHIDEEGVSSTTATRPSAATPRSAIPMTRSTRPAASDTGDGYSSRTCPRASPARTACTWTSTASPAASTSWWPGWKTWVQPASATSTRDLPGAGGSCKTRKATNSAWRRSGRGPKAPRGEQSRTPPTRERSPATITPPGTSGHPAPRVTRKRCGRSTPRLPHRSDTATCGSRLAQGRRYCTPATLAAWSPARGRPRRGLTPTSGSGAPATHGDAVRSQLRTPSAACGSISVGQLHQLADRFDVAARHLLVHRRPDDFCQGLFDCLSRSTRRTSAPGK